MPSPLVSVCMVTYDHEAYVAEAVRSVLNQTFADLQLVVVNDGSTDGTAARLAEFTDPRLVVVHQENAGPSAATNRAVAASRGKYVALFSGDDVCHPERIRRQLDEYARGGRRVLFTGCDFIDDAGRPLADGHFATTAFDLENRSRAATLATLFRRGNYFNGVSPFTERDILVEHPHDVGLIQLQDFDAWVRLAKRHDFWIMPDRLVRYRIRAAAGNLSSPRRDRMVRLNNEYYLVYRRFFDGVPADLFREALADELVRPDFADGTEYLCEQAFACCRSLMPLTRLLGVERLYGLVANPDTARVLNERYGFTSLKLYELLGSVDVMQPYDGGFSTLFWDTGAGWDEVATQSQRVFPTLDSFCLTFTVPAGCRVRELRWDPMELQTCRVRIDAIEMRDAAGRGRPVDLATVESNGDLRDDGFISFRTADPSFCWPVTGEVSTVTVRGRWQADDPLQTVLTQSRHGSKLTAELAEARRQLREVSTYRRLTAPLRAVARRLKAG
jgi:glycosyltransferase involved in cell wall biosynthesis